MTVCGKGLLCCHSIHYSSPMCSIIRRIIDLEITAASPTARLLCCMLSGALIELCFVDSRILFESNQAFLPVFRSVEKNLPLPLPQPRSKTHPSKPVPGLAHRSPPALRRDRDRFQNIAACGGTSCCCCWSGVEAADRRWWPPRFRLTSVDTADRRGWPPRFQLTTVATSSAGSWVSASVSVEDRLRPRGDPWRQWPSGYCCCCCCCCCCACC